MRSARRLDVGQARSSATRCCFISDTRAGEETRRNDSLAPFYAALHAVDGIFGLEAARDMNERAMDHDDDNWAHRPSEDTDSVIGALVCLTFAAAGILLL